MSFFRFLRETRWKFVIPLILLSSVSLYMTIPEASTFFLGFSSGLIIAPWVLSKTDLELYNKSIVTHDKRMEVKA